MTMLKQTIIIRGLDKINDIRNMIRLTAQSLKLRVVIVESISKMYTHHIDDDEQHELFRSLHALAKDLSLVIILLDNLKKIDLLIEPSDFKHELAEFYASQMLIIKRASFYDDNYAYEFNGEDKCEVVLVKNRPGDIGTVWLKYKNGIFSDDDIISNNFSVTEF